MRSISQGGLAACLLVLANTAMALPADFMQKMAAESRPLEDKQRDGARRPYQVMVIDHQGKAGQDNAMFHRMMDSDAKQWLQDAGVEIVKESNILRQNADDHTLMIDDPRLARSTDQFLFIARKPAK